MIENDWVKGKQQIRKSYLSHLSKAKKEITIVGSYFLPGRTFRRKLRAAVKRGVRVRIVVAGRSDILLAKNAERYLYRWMLKKGIEIYEYQPSVLHAKVAITDRDWFTIGSYNVNNISAYASIELNLEVCNQPLATLLLDEINKIISRDCRTVMPVQGIATYNLFQRLQQKLSYLFIKMLLYLFTFYFRQQE